MDSILKSIYKYYNTLKNVGIIPKNSEYYILISKFIYDVFTNYYKLELSKKDINAANKILECLQNNCITADINTIQDIENISSNIELEDILVNIEIPNNSNNDSGNTSVIVDNYSIISILFENLPTVLGEHLLGNHYNVINSFVVDDRFLEYNPDTPIEVGAGSDIQVVLDNTGNIKYNVFYNNKINSITDIDISIIVS
jgi:hypothetical protein